MVSDIFPISINCILINIIRPYNSMTCIYKTQVEASGSTE